MNKPNISDKFTIEDIHEIREYNAERRKRLTLKERLADIRKSADECEKEFTSFYDKVFKSVNL